jgi:hypothetical protein
MTPHSKKKQALKSYGITFCRKVDLDSKDKSSIVSFSLSDEPALLELSHYRDKEKVSGFN